MSRPVVHKHRPIGNGHSVPSRAKVSSPPRRDRTAPPTVQPEAAGQTLVEFALVLVVSMVVTVGLLDGLRVIFYYSQIQEAARQGARWGAVQVARAVTSDGAQTVGGTFGVQGNESGTYCDPAPSASCNYSLQSSLSVSSTNPITPTIVGATIRAANAVSLSQATIRIDTGIPTTAEISQTDPLFTNSAVTVTVSYPFKPLLGMVFGGVSIPLKGSSSMLHE
jgi:Flp pilus assembly protein TadG